MDDAPRISLDLVRPRATWPVRLRQVFALVVTTFVFTVGALLMLILAALTLFRARRFYAEVYARNLMQLGFWLHGIRLVVHGAELRPQGQVVYISNHTSALDPMVVVALGLPNCRYFMSGFLRAILPVWIVAGLIGTFWTFPQIYQEKRRRLFQGASELLERTGESVYLTPEGQRCWSFNRGAFHLATSLRVPMVPFFISIPLEVDPGPWIGMKYLDARAGEIHIHFRPAIDTSDWQVAEVDQHRLEARRMYLEWARELQDKSAQAAEVREER